MSFTAGQKLAASDLDLIGSTSFQFIGAAQTTGSISLTSSQQDLTGTSLTFTTQYANTKCAIWATFDATCANSTNLLIGICVVDGVSLAANGEAHFKGATANARATVGQQWTVTLALAGSHTIKLQAEDIAGAGSMTTSSVATRWSALVFGP